MYDLLLLGPDQMSDNATLIGGIVGAVVGLLLIGIVVITVIIVVLAKSRHDKYTTRR